MYRARRVLKTDRRGSSWPVLIETDAGVFCTKLRGAAQAPASLVAEIIVGSLADALGLSVPARVLIDLPPDVPVEDPHEDILGLDFEKLTCRCNGRDMRLTDVHGKVIKEILA